jgi:hypothetical protein
VGINMHSIAHTDEDTNATPTRPVEPVREGVLMLAKRIERLAELCAERIACCPDDDALAAAVGDLLQIRELARAVPR